MQTKKSNKTIVKAIPLVTYFSGIRKNDRAVMQETYFPLSDKTQAKTYIYYPQNKDPNTLPGIMFLHGMSVKGIDDPRMLTLAKNVALSGYTVVTPEIEEIRSLKIGEDSIGKCIELFEYFYKLEDFHKKDSVGFLSASFSGSLGLVAFSQDRVRDLVRSAMVVGSYCDFADTTSYAVKNFEVDSYASLVLFYNCLGLVDKNLNKELSFPIFQYAVDNGLNRVGQYAEGPKEHRNLKPSSREFLDNLLNDSEFRSNIVRIIREEIPHSLTKNLSPYYHLSTLKTPLSLLHGLSDPVISPTQSERMYRQLSNRKHPVTLELSNLITHGDQVPIRTQITGVAGVARAFGSYFSWFS
jgi:acetyl esterase/lipase